MRARVRRNARTGMAGVAMLGVAIACAAIALPAIAAPPPWTLPHAPGVPPPASAPRFPDAPAPATSHRGISSPKASSGTPATPGGAIASPAQGAAGLRGSRGVAYDPLRTLSADLPENAPVERRADGNWIAAADIARLLGATKYWHGVMRKLELRAVQHTIQFTVDNPFVLVDERTVELSLPVRSEAGQLRVPVALIDSLPRDSTLARLIYDARRGLVFRVPAEGLVRTLRIEQGVRYVRVTFPTERPEEAVVVGRGRAHFRLRLGGFFVGALPDTQPPGGLLRGARLISSAQGSAFEFAVNPDAQGFSISPSRHGEAVELLITRDAGLGLERFAPEGPPGERQLKVVVLDPGHGEMDLGVTSGAAVEKNLTVALAHLLAHEIESHLGAHVVLTRTDDRNPTMQERAETANRAHADVVLSLHFDGALSGRAHGVTAYCPPATFGGGAASERPGPQPLVLLPWRDVATRHAVRSRELAEAVLSSLDLRGLGPTRLRETLPFPLLGVNAPGLLIECATLTSDADRARLLSPVGLGDLARAIAAGLDAYRRAE